MQSFLCPPRVGIGKDHESEHGGTAAWEAKGGESQIWGNLATPSLEITFQNI